MSRSLKLLIAGLVSVSALALLLTSFVFSFDTSRVLGVRPSIAPSVFRAGEPEGVLLGVAFWTVITLFASALPVRMPFGTLVSVAIAPIVAAMALGGPVAAGWVALLGTTELRELRGKIPWYGTLANHASIVLPAVLGGLVFEAVAGPHPGPSLSFLATMAGAITLFVLNFGIASLVVALRTGQRIRIVLV